MQTTWLDGSAQRDAHPEHAADHPDHDGDGDPNLDGRSGFAPLEEALARHVARLAGNGLEQQRLEAVLDRLGFRGRPPLTLAEAGRVAGLSGERVRQLEVRLRKQQASSDATSLPQLDAALEAVADAVPLPAHRVPEVLEQAGVTRRPFSAESLLAAAGLLDRHVPFAVSGSGADAVLLPEIAAEAATHTARIDARGRRQVERTGASTVTALAAELAQEDVVLSPAQIDVVLRSCTAAVVRDDGWFWYPEGSCDGAFVRASRRMLAVTSALPVESLHDGLRRHNAFRRRPAPPPVDVLAEVYADHSAFSVKDGVVTSVHPLDPAIVGPLNQRILDLLRAAPGGVMARAPLLEACHGAELNLTSVNLYTTYSECIERVGPGVFAPRGSADSAAADVARRTPSARPADAWPSCGWTADGRPWLAGRVTASTWANGVLHVPAEVQPALRGRHFRSTSAAGGSSTLGVDHHGNSWGWTSFLRRAGAAPGDVVRATFDPGPGTVVLEVLAGAAASTA